MLASSGWLAGPVVQMFSCKRAQPSMWSKESSTPQAVSEAQRAKGPFYRPPAESSENGRMRLCQVPAPHNPQVSQVCLLSLSLGRKTEANHPQCPAFIPDDPPPSDFHWSQSSQAAPMISGHFPTQDVSAIPKIQRKETMFLTAWQSTPKL